MRNTLAIAEREMKSYFVSPIAYIIMAAFLLIAGYLFSVILLNTREASLRYLQSNLSVIWLFVAPFLTMRLLAEENRMGTIELLLTNPVRDYEVVFGKYLGALAFVLVMVACTLYYPALLYAFGSPDSGPMIAGYVGVILQAAAFLAIGLMVSSFTQNQIVAAFLTFALLLLMWLSDSIANFIGKPFGDVMKYLSVTSHFQDFSRGVIDSSHVIYFASVVAAALFITYLSLQMRRWRA
ncbi:MAG: ABC transporter permease subunit [Chloroflexi bacterium]|nr:ABC transporter permease subunit [Chloroflexota bacterium]